MGLFVRAQFWVPAEQVELFQTLATALVEASRAEAGCRSYHLCQRPSDGDDAPAQGPGWALAWLWADQNAFDGHGASAHFQEYLPQLSALATDEPLIEVLPVLL